MLDKIEKLMGILIKIWVSRSEQLHDTDSLLHISLVVLNCKADEAVRYFGEELDRLEGL